MLPAIYESVPHRIAVLTWPEASAADLRLLVGTENVNVTPSVIQVCNGEGKWETLGDGWAVAVADGTGDRNVMSSSMLATKYRKADGG
jgi:hypothetical protein